MDRVLFTFIVVFVYVGTALGAPLPLELTTFLKALDAKTICNEFPPNGLIQEIDLTDFFDRCGNSSNEDAFLEIVCGNIANLSLVMCHIADKTTVEVKQIDVVSHFKSMKNDAEQTTCESGAFLRLIRESKSTTEECIKTCKNSSGCILFRAMMDSAAAAINETKDFKEVDVFIHSAQTFFPYPPLSTMDAGGPLEQCMNGNSSVCAAVKELAVLLAQSGAPPVSYLKFMSSIENTIACDLFPLNVTLQAHLRNLTLQAPVWASLVNITSCKQICNEASTICNALVVGLDSLISALKNPTATSRKLDSTQKTTATTSKNPDGTKNVTTAPNSSTNTTAPGNKTNSRTETPAPDDKPSSPTTTTAPGVNNEVTTNATKATGGSTDASTKTTATSDNIPSTIPLTSDNTRATTSSPSSSTPSTVEAPTDSDENQKPDEGDDDDQFEPHSHSKGGEENNDNPPGDEGSDDEEDPESDNPPEDEGNDKEEMDFDNDNPPGDEGNDKEEMDFDNEAPNKSNKAQDKPVDTKGGSNAAVQTDDDDDESAGGISFMSYFLVGTVLCVAGYIVFHNKQKIIALIVEGKSVNGGSRRPSSKEYRRLKTEDVMPSLERSTTSTNYVY